jgi:polyisoprenoid-binding protein YceI
MKKNLFSLAAGMLLMTATHAEGWKLDAAHSRIHFKAPYLLITDTEVTSKSSMEPLPQPSPTGPI